MANLSNAHHGEPKPFVWTESADHILESIARYAQRTLDFQAAPLIARTTRTGHYGALAFLVGQRAREIGVRMALWRKARGVMWIVLLNACVLVVSRLTLGTVGAWS